jgi:hypothetical protein
MSDTSSNITFFRTDGHLTEESIAAYTEALLGDDFERLPKEILAHVEHCEACQHEAIELYGLIATLPEKEKEEPDQDEENTDQPQAKPRTNPLWRWALVALTAALALYIYRAMPIAPEAAPKEQQQAPTSTPSQFMDPQQKPVDRPVAESESPKQTEKPTEGTALYAANFVPYEQLESLAGEVMRSAGVEALAPTKEQVFRPGSLVKFQWKNETQTPLQLILLDNHGKELLRHDATTTNFDWQSLQRQGLYYWKLESPDELLFVGKFLLKQ